MGTLISRDRGWREEILYWTPSAGPEERGTSGPDPACAGQAPAGARRVVRDRPGWPLVLDLTRRHLPAVHAVAGPAEGPGGGVPSCCGGLATRP